MVLILDGNSEQVFSEKKKSIFYSIRSNQIPETDQINKTEINT